MNIFYLIIPRRRTKVQEIVYKLLFVDYYFRAIRKKLSKTYICTSGSFFSAMAKLLSE